MQGEKAVEAALVEGNQLVVDKDVDVFAVASEKGMYSLDVPCRCDCIVTVRKCMITPIISPHAYL